MRILHGLASSVPPEIMGLPTWALNGLSIGSLVMFIIVGLATNRLWTKGQINELVKQHEREVERMTADHEREAASVKERYELHLTRTVELYQGRVEDAVRREGEWRDNAQQWQETANLLANGLEPLQDQGETMLAILRAWQGNRPGRRAT